MNVDPTVAIAHRHVILGTAGHIDHGKTSLVRRLTGINTDRLPEEKARGISIELGFAHFQVGNTTLHVVDVPGHERFVKNMTAGATGIDVALLVVAADDGVMPQTVEHLEIMDLLGIQQGVIAITKIDLVDPEMVELVRMDIAEHVAGTFLENAPMVPVSSHTGAGYDTLSAHLVSIAERYKKRARTPLFRLPIDRVFSVQGHGSVVTGSVWSGTVHAGDTLELLPNQEEVRVRGVQQHGTATGESAASRRCAINLAGTKTSELTRGQELATRGWLRPATRLLVKLKNLSSSPGPLKHRSTYQLHLGADEVAARLILRSNEIVPGGTGVAELRLERPVVAEWGQKFILRRISPARTLGGGTIVDPGVPNDRKIGDLEAAIEPRIADDPLVRLAAYFLEQDSVTIDPLHIAWSVGVAPSEVAVLIETLRKKGDLLQLSANGGLVHKQRITSLADTMLLRIRQEIAHVQPRKSLPRATLINSCHRLASAELLEAAWRRLVTTNRLVAVGENFGPADLQIQLSKAQQALKAALLARFEQASGSPPTEKELAAELSARPEAIDAILKVCQEEDLLVFIGAGLYYTPNTLERLLALTREKLAIEPATVSQLREIWGVSRKYGIPLCEFFDARGVTTRDGDLRRLGTISSLRGQS